MKPLKVVKQKGTKVFLPVPSFLIPCFNFYLPLPSTILSFFVISTHLCFLFFLLFLTPFTFSPSQPSFPPLSLVFISVLSSLCV